MGTRRLGFCFALIISSSDAVSRGSVQELVGDIAQVAEGIYTLGARSYASLRCTRGGHDVGNDTSGIRPRVVRSFRLSERGGWTWTDLDLHRLPSHGCRPAATHGCKTFSREYVS